MKSEADVRNKDSELFGNTNLIIHQGAVKIFDKTIKILCILGVVEEVYEILSGRH